MLVSSLVAACHSAACRPPTSGGTGGSSPGKDTGRKIGDETVYEFNDDGQRGFTVRGKDGVPLRAVFSVRHPIYDPDPNSTIDNALTDGVALEALSGLKTAYDLAPSKVVPGIVLGDFSSALGGIPTERLYGFIMPYAKPDAPIGRGKIGINISPTTYPYYIGSKQSETAMPISREVPFGTYAAAHEYGHHRQYHGGDKKGVVPLYHKHLKDPDLSPYGKTDPLEAGAEVFASWSMKGGRATTPIEQAYAEEMGWGRTGQLSVIGILEFVLNYEGIQVVADTLDGPVYVLKNGRTVRPGSARSKL